MVGKVVAGSRPGLDDPNKENFWLGSFGTMFIGLITIAFHGWFLFYLEVEYAENYALLPHILIVRDYVALWVPVFLGSIIIESLYFYITAPNSSVYRLNDALSNICLGSVSQLAKTLLSQVILLHGPYAWIWQNYGQYTVQRFPLLQNPVVAWWAMLFGVDFCYYWVHRTGHTVNAFWAMHGVHHSAESYNFTTALRQSSIHMFVSWAYYAPLAFFFPVPLFLIHNQFNLLYQYWIHTQVIGKLGPLEYVLNTPSQHRVHHGRNEYCIDKNYGGILCIYDRLFGTFQEEIDDVPVVFGLTHSINTFNPLKVNLNAWKAIFANARDVKGVKNKILCFFNGPGWIPGSSPSENYGIPPCTRNSVVQYYTDLSGAWKCYVVVLFLYGLVGLQASSMALSRTVGCLYWYSLCGAIYSGFTFYCIGVACDLDPSTVLLQMLHAVLGSIYLSYGIFYLQNTFQEYILMEFGVVCIVGTLTIIFLLWRKKDIHPTRIQLGYDKEFTAEAEKAQWLLITPNKQE